MRRILSAQWAVTLGIVVMVLATTTARSLLTPLFSSGDEMAHFDYAVQVWHGDLPVFEDGLAVQTPWGSRPPVQWTSQHPPLFYLLLAPVVGPLYDAGHVYLAGMAGRALNSVIAAALCVAVMWAVRPLSGGRRHLPWIAGFAAASSFWVMGVGSAIYNDDIAALEITLVLGAALRLVTLPRERPGAGAVPSVPASAWWVLGAAAVAASLTRLALLPLIAVVLAVLVLRGLAAPGPLSRVAWVLRPTLVGLAMAAASGWFYLRNLHLTGSVSGGHPDWAMENTARTQPPVAEVATDPVYWAKLFGIFSAGNTPSGLTLWGLLAVPVLLGLLLAGAAALRSADGEGPRPFPLPGVVLLLGVAGGLTAMQFVYVSSQAGNLFPRYSLPLLTLTCLLLAWGLGGLRRATPVLFGAWATVAWWQIVSWFLALPRSAGEGEAWLRPDLALPLVAVSGLAAAATAVLIAVASQRDPQPSAPSAASSSWSSPGSTQTR